MFNSSEIWYSAMVLVNSYVLLVKSSWAGPPFLALYLIPKSFSGPPGLWEAVKINPPKHCCCSPEFNFLMYPEIAGVD